MLKLQTLALVIVLGCEVAIGQDSLDDTTRALPERQIEKVGIRENVNRVLKELESNDREILILKDVQGLSYEEISKVLDLPMGTVKSRIARARLAFKETWKRMEF